MPILQSEVYFVELGPTKGKELDRKRRPVVVVSINEINLKPLVVMIVPGKTYRPGKRVFENEVMVEPSRTNGLRYVTLFECFQMKALDHSRFDQGPVGILSDDEMARVVKAIMLCITLP